MTTLIPLHKDVEARLDTLAAQTGRPKSYYIREMILNQIEDLEDYYLAAQTMERVSKGQESLFSTAEVRKNLGLED